MRRRLAQVPIGVVILVAVGLGIASGLVAANATGAWVRIFRTGSGPICSQPPCATPSIVVSPAEFAVFRPSGDIGLAVGVAVAILVVVIWVRARRALRSRTLVNR